MSFTQRKRLGVLLVMVLSCFLCTCRAESSILDDLTKDRWQTTAGVVYEFLEDGTVLTSDGINGNFNILSDGRIKMVLKMPFIGDQIAVVKVSFRDDKMFFTDPSGRGGGIEFRRIRR
jgi:hypothetical protein